MPAPPNPFSYFEQSLEQRGIGDHWLVRVPERPGARFDLNLVPRSPTWRDDPASLHALEQIERQPWAGLLTRSRDGVRLRLRDGWIETLGERLQQGEAAGVASAAIDKRERFVVQACDGSSTGALELADLRGLALSGALANALAEAGAHVELRTLIAAPEVKSTAGRRGWLSGRRATLERLGVVSELVSEADFVKQAGELGARAAALGHELTPAQARALAYWQAAPGLRGKTSVCVCEAQSGSHFVSADGLADELIAAGTGDAHPTHVVVYEHVYGGEQALAPGGPPLSIDELMDWLSARVEETPPAHELAGRVGGSAKLARQLALGYFLPRPLLQRVDLFVEKLLRARESPGWDLARAYAADASSSSSPRELAADGDYRFAVVHAAQLGDRLALALERLDPGPLARHSVSFARWSLQRERSEAVQRVIRTALAQELRVLGLQ
jgi:hypothetical protein